MKALALNFSLVSCFADPIQDLTKLDLLIPHICAKELEDTLLFAPWSYRPYRGAACTHLHRVLILALVHGLSYAKKYGVFTTGTTLKKNRTTDFLKIKALRHPSKYCWPFFPKNFLANQTVVKMVPPEGETSNSVIEVLEEWNDYLENHVPYFRGPQEPQP